MLILGLTECLVCGCVVGVWCYVTEVGRWGQQRPWVFNLGISSNKKLSLPPRVVQLHAVSFFAHQTMTSREQMLWRSSPNVSLASLGGSVLTVAFRDQVCLSSSYRTPELPRNMASFASDDEDEDFFVDLTTLELMADIPDQLASMLCGFGRATCAKIKKKHPQFADVIDGLDWGEETFDSTFGYGDLWATMSDDTKTTLVPDWRTAAQTAEVDSSRAVSGVTVTGATVVMSCCKLNDTITLENVSEDDIDMAGWSIYIDGGSEVYPHSFTFPTEFVLHPGTPAVLYCAAGRAQKDTLPTLLRKEREDPRCVIVWRTRHYEEPSCQLKLHSGKKKVTLKRIDGVVEKCCQCDPTKLVSVV